MSKSLDEAAEAAWLHATDNDNQDVNGQALDSFKVGARWALRESDDVKALVAALERIADIRYPEQRFSSEVARKALASFKAAIGGD